MITEYVTSNGYRLGVGRISRQRIDAFAGKRPIPKPPVKSASELGIPVFGGEKAEAEEMLPIWDDPEYLEELQNYYQKIGAEEFDLIAKVITLLDDVPEETLAEVNEFGIDTSDPANFLRFVVLDNDHDLTKLTALVFYNSTVTPRGMMEAVKTFDVTFNDEPVAPMAKSGPAKASPMFGHRQAAKANNYTWEEFCTLPGPEQSAVVAFHRLGERLQWLMSKR